MEGNDKGYPNNQSNRRQRPECRCRIVARRYSVAFSNRLRQHVYQCIAGETKISQGHPEQKAADGQPHAVPLCAEVMNR